jgi:hypothetical protein
MIRDTMKITMFWNKLKFPDQNSACTSIKRAQQMITMSVATIGMNGISSLFGMPK